MAVSAAIAAFVASAGITGTAGVVLASVGTALAAAAASTVVNLVVGAVAGRGRPASQAGRFGIRTDLRSGVVGRSILLGRCATAGSLVYANTWGEEGAVGDAYLTLVIALSDLPVRELTGVWINGEKVVLDEAAATSFGSPVEEYRDEAGVDHAWIKFKDGTQGIADTFLQNKVSSHGRLWGADRIGDGVAHAIVTLLFDRELFSGIPNLLFEVNGARLYDPSKDSSAGGDGDQRWNDPESWGGGQGDFNPAVQLYNILRGLRWRGKLVYGLDTLSGWQLPAADWIGQIEICRADVDEADGAQRRYTAGGEAPLEAPVAETVEQLLAACHGRLTDSAGRVMLRCGPPPDPVGHLSDGGILAESEQVFTAFEGLDQAVNVLTATHPDPDQAWSVRESPPVVWDGLIEQDGGRRLAGDVQLDFVFRKEQARRLIKSGLRDGRRQRRHTLALPPEWWVLDPGDVIRWTSARHGYRNKRFTVEAVVDQPNLDVVVSLREVNPNDFNWDTSVDYDAPLDGTVSAARPAAQSLFSVAATGVSLRDGSFDRRPAIDLTWDATLGRVDGVEAVRWQLRLAADGSSVAAGRVDEPSAGAVRIPQGVLPGVAYEVRARPVLAQGRRGAWSSWIAVAAPTTRFQTSDVEDDAVVAQSYDQALSVVALTSSWQTLVSVAVDRTMPGDVECLFSLRVSGGTADIRVREDGDLVAGSDINFETGASSWFALRQQRPTVGVTTFTLEARIATGTPSVTKAALKCLQIKRNA